MEFSDSSKDLTALIAASVDICMKPYLHSVIRTNLSNKESSKEQDYLELIMRIECRSRNGERHPENDLELEIYRSGDDLNLMISWSNQIDRPMLWQGKHSVWMDPNTGKRSQSPEDGNHLESLARRLRALFISKVEQ